MGGGSGVRFLPLREKILIKVHGMPLYCYSMYNFFSTITDWSLVVIVCSLSNQGEIVSFLRYRFPFLLSKVRFSTPGETRGHSVWNAIKDFSADQIDQIWIHDLARPCISVEDIKNLQQLSLVDSNLPLIPGKVVTDSLKKICVPVVENQKLSVIEGSMQRNEFVRASTPQIFSFSKLQTSYASSIKDSSGYTDDHQVYSSHFFNEQSFIYFCKNPNPKLTFSADLVTVSGFLEKHDLL